jgi:hypothetical protein
MSERTVVPEELAGRSVVDDIWLQIHRFLANATGEARLGASQGFDRLIEREHEATRPGG